MNDLTQYEKEALLKKIKIKWIYNSNAIEGNTLSEGDTSFIIEHGLTVQGKSLLEHNQVVGHLKAIDLIYAILEKDTIEQEDLFLLHKAIQTETLIDYERPVGAYKALPNGRWIHIDGKDEHYYYPDPDDIKHLMGLWFEKFANIGSVITSKEEAIKVYTQMHTSFVAIHPFYDGNGRIARLVANLPLLKNNYLPIIVDTQLKDMYTKLLFAHNMTYELNDDTKALIIENDAYLDLVDFFEEQYKNTENILNTLRESTIKMEAMKAKRLSKRKS